MFYHVVMMRYTDGADAEFHRRVEAFVARVRKECDGVLHYGHGANVASRGRGYVFAVLGVFESSAAHDRYQASPVHQEMKAYMTPFIADLVVCDTDLPS